MNPFVSVVETHSGVVFLVGDRAYKLKKPVSFGFLDFTRPGIRRTVCEREVELNSRLAPDVYMGVADLLGPDGSPCEHFVVMRRLPDERRLSVLAGEEGPGEVCVERVVRTLASFHGKAKRSDDIDACARAAAVLERWQAVGRQMEGASPPIFDPGIHEHVDGLVRRYLAGREALFESRVLGGCICDGHGDLLCDDVFCLDDGPRMLDCVEFDDRLRYVDVLDDVASLAMDLERIGRPDLGQLLLQRYRAVSGDDWPESLADHYIAYRAWMRSMVAGLRSQQGDTHSAAEARKLTSTAVEHLERARVRLLVIGGLPGTGKSSLALEVAKGIAAETIRSDEVRKRLAGIAPTTRAAAAVGEGIYAPEMTVATYEALLEEARTNLGLGRSVVLDATFADPRWRAAAQALAKETSSDLHEFRCVAPMEVIEARIAGRTQGPSISDASAEIAHRMALSEARWPTATDIDTSRDLAQPSAEVLRLVTRR